jgi:PAS domain S-box-containing protein
MTGITWKPVSVIASLLLLLTYFLCESRPSDLTLCARMQEALQMLQLRDAELTRDTLLVRAELLPSYDSLARTSADLFRVLGTLRRESKNGSGQVAQAVHPHIEALGAALQEKATRLEYFKSDVALLRNSVVYFDRSGQALRIRGEGDTEFMATLGELSHAMLHFMRAPDISSEREIEALLKRLANPALSQTVPHTLIAHGELISQVLPQVDSQLREILAAPTATGARTLQEALLQYSHRAEARAEVFRFLLYSAALVLLGYLMHQFRRLRNNTLELRRTNAELSREMAEREQAEGALRASEERFRAITDTPNDAIVSADSDGAIVSWNRGAQAIFGYEAAEILGSPVTRLTAPHHRALDWRHFAQRGESRFDGTAVELVGVRKDGAEFPFEISLATWSTAHGDFVTGIIRDITVRKRLEETARQQELQLIQANKMTALGTLVSGVAHEINNPNQLVLTNSEVLTRVWNDTANILDRYRHESGDFTLAGLAYSEMRTTIPVLIHDVHASALRIGQIVDDLKDFARPRGRGAVGCFQLNDAVKRALRLLRHLIDKRTTKLRTDLAPKLPVVSGDVRQMEQVVVNLLVNALEALPDRQCGVSVSTSYDPGEGSVVLQVRDEGIGISGKHLQRLCEPFFTTKAESGGTGLGLAIASTLIRAHDGRLAFDSELGRGTRVQVRLPCHVARVPANTMLAA